MKRQFLKALFGFLALFGIAGVGSLKAQSMPQSYSILVGFPAGGQTFLQAQTFAKELEEVLKVKVICEAMPGAGGIIPLNRVHGASQVDNQIIFGSVASVTGQLMNPVPWDLVRDFDLLTLSLQNPIYIVARKSLGVKNIEEFDKYVKANPGKVNYGSAGNGSFTTAYAEHHAKLMGWKTESIHYKGTNFTTEALIKSEVDYIATGFWPDAQQLQQNGYGVILFNSSKNRHNGVPAVIKPGIEGSLYIGMFVVSKKMRPEIRESLTKALVEVHKRLVANPPPIVKDNLLPEPVLGAKLVEFVENDFKTQRAMFNK
jgi:tripartite-type tricarboxylate transporter receptor subunit TctC